GVSRLSPPGRCCREEASMDSAKLSPLTSHWLAALFTLAMISGSARSELVCQKPLVNAGVVYTGTCLAQRFVLVNRGDAAAEVIEAKASCGCLSPRLSRRMVNPGEGVAVDLEINTLSQPSG